MAKHIYISSIDGCGSIQYQSFTLKKYPAELSLTAWICLMGTVEGSIVTLVMERDMSVWAIGWDSRLLAAVYSVSIYPILDHESWLYSAQLHACSIYIYIYIYVHSEKNVQLALIN
jgi:hypothetical protein